MYELTPNIEWYAAKSKSLNLTPRCPFATAENCPGYYQSLSLIKKDGFAGIDDKTDKKLLKKWKNSTLWPAADEQFTSISGTPEKKNCYARFCPEVSFLCFGLFASKLFGYIDEIDIDTAYSQLRKKNYPRDHWRWSWAYIVPQHYSECNYYSLLLSYDGGNMEKDSNIQANKIFIGHGRSKIWKDLKDFIQDRLKLEWDEFEREPTAGMSVPERLNQMLDDASFAFIIMTAEDEHADKSLHARENVIHEVGLFQGRLGFKKAIILLEEGCKEFSNIHGLIQIRFPHERIAAKYEEIRKVLEREHIIR